MKDFLRRLVDRGAGTVNETATPDAVGHRADSRLHAVEQQSRAAFEDDVPADASYGKSHAVVAPELRESIPIEHADRLRRVEDDADDPRAEDAAAPHTGASTVGRRPPNDMPTRVATVAAMHTVVPEDRPSRLTRHEVAQQSAQGPVSPTRVRRGDAERLLPNGAQRMGVDAGLTVAERAGSGDRDVQGGATPATATERVPSVAVPVPELTARGSRKAAQAVEGAIEVPRVRPASPLAAVLPVAPNDSYERHGASEVMPREAVVQRPRVTAEEMAASLAGRESPGRSVSVHIGAIEIGAAAPAATRPAAAAPSSGFDEFTALRMYAPWPGR